MHYYVNVMAAIWNSKNFKLRNIQFHLHFLLHFESLYASFRKKLGSCRIKSEQIIVWNGNFKLRLYVPIIRLVKLFSFVFTIYFSFSSVYVSTKMKIRWHFNCMICLIIRLEKQLPKWLDSHQWKESDIV